MKDRDNVEDKSANQETTDPETSIEIENEKLVPLEEQAFDTDQETRIHNHDLEADDHNPVEEKTNKYSGIIVSLDEKREQINVDEGIKWLHKAITAGDIESMSEMAYLYLTGGGVPKNIEEGRKWLERAAEAGDPWAMMELGFRLLVGEDFEQDRKLGEKWLRRAAERNYPVAMRILGYRLLTGDELEQNIQEGEKWLRKAAEAGEPIAMREWGKYLIYGIKRIIKSD